MSNALLLRRDKLLADLARALVDDWEAQGLFKSCLNCDHFNEAFEMCQLAGKRPPARVIVSGCEQHTDEIPF